MGSHCTKMSDHCCTTPVSDPTAIPTKGISNPLSPPTESGSFTSHRGIDEPETRTQTPNVPLSRNSTLPLEGLHHHEESFDSRDAFNDGITRALKPRHTDRRIEHCPSDCATGDVMPSCHGEESVDSRKAFNDGITRVLKPRHIAKAPTSIFLYEGTIWCSKTASPATAPNQYHSSLSPLEFDGGGNASLHGRTSSLPNSQPNVLTAENRVSSCLQRVPVPNQRIQHELDCDSVRPRTPHKTA